jgi:hypothetical protein
MRIGAGAGTGSGRGPEGGGSGCEPSDRPRVSNSLISSLISGKAAFELPKGLLFKNWEITNDVIDWNWMRYLCGGR